MQSSKYIVASIFFVCATSGANADPDKFYVEGAVGTFSDGYFVLDENEYSLVGARFGYDINTYFSIEGEYLFGTNTHSSSFPSYQQLDGTRVTGVAETNLDSTYGLYGKARIPFGDRFAAHARLGYGERTLEFSSRTTNPANGVLETFNTSVSEDYLAMGLGATFDFSDKLYARADLTSQADEVISDEYSATVSVGFRF